jgi:hypothetical protein
MAVSAVFCLAIASSKTSIYRIMRKGAMRRDQISGAMSLMGQKRKWDCRSLLSALPPKADIRRRVGHVRFVPKADICTAANNRRSRTYAVASLSVSDPDFFSLLPDLADSSLNFVPRNRAYRMIDYDGRKVGHAESLQRQFGLFFELSRDDRG